MTEYIPNDTTLVAIVVDGEVEVLPVLMEDDLLHTAENGYCCGIDGCPCMTTSYTFDD